jgi:hypothetical protein
MNPIFLLDATFIMLFTFLFAAFFHHTPDKPTTLIAASVLFVYGIVYLIINKPLFAALEVFTGLGWIILYKWKGSNE